MQPTFQGSTQGGLHRLLQDGYAFHFSWHYLVVFSPLVANQTALFNGFLLERQLAVLASMAAAFALALLAHTHPRSLPGKASGEKFLWVVSVLGGLSTLLSLTLQVESFIILSSAVLGFCEGVLSAAWLAIFCSDSKGNVNSRSTPSTVAGTSLCLVLCCLDRPLAVLVASTLPCAATYFLLQTIRGTNKNQDSAATRGDRGPGETVIELVCAALVLMAVIIACIFGFLASTYYEASGFLLGATNPYAIVGAIAAYAIAYFMLEKRNNRLALYGILCLSPAFFLLGALGVMHFPESPARVVFEASLIAGFHLFDYGTVTITADMAAGPKHRAIKGLCANRSLFYFFLMIGFASVLTLAPRDQAWDEFIPVATFFSVILLCVAFLALFVFLFFNASLSNSRGEAHQACASDDQTVADEPPSPTSHLGNRTAQESPAKCETQATVSFEETCERFASANRLTPRETEVFMLMAKGRRAEYISHQLWISIYTAKTHIANIYRKTDIHSMDELFKALDELNTGSGPN